MVVAKNYFSLLDTAEKFSHAVNKVRAIRLKS